MAVPPAAAGFAGQNVLLTGLPRSGTSLACVLLNQVDNVAALVEPLELGDLPRDTPAADLVARINAFCAQNRRSAIERGEVVSQTHDGAIPDNTSVRGPEGERKSVVARGTVRMDRRFDEHMTLVLKHPGPFTALAPLLSPAFPMFAMVRHPVAVLASWSTFRRGGWLGSGRMKIPERFDDGLRRRLEATADVLDRQIVLLNWFFSRYRDFPSERVLRYEEMVASGGRSLSVIAPGAASLDRPLESRNAPVHYEGVDMERIVRRLEQCGGSYRAFYPAVDDILAGRDRP